MTANREVTGNFVVERST